MDRIKQSDRLAIRVNAENTMQLPDDIAKILSGPHRETHYYLVMMLEGEDNQRIDMKDYTVSPGQILFVLPNQIHWSGRHSPGSRFFNIVFDENCLALLPHTHKFLFNPLHNPLISLPHEAVVRLRSIFSNLSGLLKKQGNTETVLAYLNVLLTECNSFYFHGYHYNMIQDHRFDVYIQFQQYVERELGRVSEITLIAEKLAISVNSLYQIVKQYAGLSPKQFIINRLMLEAQRKLYNGNHSTKAIAYELGFSDPDYFARLFKKNLGKKISQFISEMTDL
ncbi:AraC family transcriptional regulator [Mucilaginibacter pedocola]|uniref:AraC family transcriptional regulator n=1 Tax=Mucilaginibacter pedocola TaxID=1792845 RepID=UPI0013900766|nr:helix-turn-helix domain-containing protein [Mucilaginibacter pedocola]